MNFGMGITVLPGANPVLPLDNIPSVVNAAALPASDTVGRVFYYTQDTKSWYFWNGAAWVLILDDSDHADLQTVIAGLAAHIASTTAHSANHITNTPAGNLSSTDVQGALNELQGDADTAIAAAAAASSAAATVQTNLTNHINNTTGAHAATAISVTPAGNIASTDVQAALVELQGDIDTLQTYKTAVVANSALANASTFDPVSTNRRQVQQVSGSGGAVTLTDIGVTSMQEGDELTLMGTDDTNTVTIVSATNALLNGSCTLAANDMITFVFVNSKWRERSRSA